MTAFRQAGWMFALGLVFHLGAQEEESPQARYERWSRALVAPCCWSESIEAHRSPAAARARAELREMIEQGRSDQEIRDAFVAGYGDAILIVPDGERGQWLFTVPAIVVLLAAAAAVFRVRKMLAKNASPDRYVDPPEIEIDDAELE